MHRFIANENMLLLKELLAAIEEDNGERTRWLLAGDNGRAFENFRKQLIATNFEEINSTANGFKMICLWAAYDGNESLLQLLLSKMGNQFDDWELAGCCFDMACRFDQIKCVEVSYFKTGKRKVNELRVKYEHPLIYAAKRNRIELVRFLLKIGADPLFYSGYETPIEIAKGLKNKDIYFLLKDAAEGSSKLSLKLRLFSREMKWPSL